MNTPKFVVVSRAWINQLFQNNREVDISLAGPRFKLKFKLDEPLETRSGIDPSNKSPFYESDAKALFKYYHGYRNTPEYMDNVLYVDVVPFRSTGFNGISLGAVQSEDVIVTIEPSSYHVPEKLQDHADAALDLFKRMKKLRWLEGTQEWENNTSLRVDSVDPAGKFCCRKARYFDQVATNITLDWASGKLADGWRTIRSGMERPDGGRLRPLRDSNLANTLGVAVMLYDRTLSPILRVRSDSLASIPKQGLHCTASGVHEVDPMQAPGVFDFTILERGMMKEIKDEIGLEEDEYRLFPVAFARELPRGGKPQLFFVALAKVDKERIREGMYFAEEAYEYVGGASEHVPTMIGSPKPTSELFTYEGWACLRFAERFIEANKDKLSRLDRSDR